MNSIGRDFNSDIVITVNVVSYDEEAINDKTNEVKTTNFSFITSLNINQRNKEDIVKLGPRWKNRK